MIQCKGIAHFSIPVSDLEKSTKFYSDVVGLKLITTDGKRHSFMDAGGTCILLCSEESPINADNRKDLVHHAFMISDEDLARAKGILEESGAEVLYEEDRQGGTVNGPRIYFRDPDGTRLEFIKLTSYDTTPN
ncbi:MAG: VOC family protein [Alphaproteobacteria bacterium]|nr:VOC family protein [Pseudomonadota bacterium]TDI66861.1 MAG: VOC family protein [Alphaproteobacteria bacterium]